MHVRVRVRVSSCARVRVCARMRMRVRVRARMRADCLYVNFVDVCHHIVTKPLNIRNEVYNIFTGDFPKSITF